MSIPESNVARDTIKSYIKEAVANLREQDVLKLRMKEIKDSVKESELMDAKEFTLLVKAAYDMSRLQEEVDVKSEAIANIEILGL